MRTLASALAALLLAACTPPAAEPPGAVVEAFGKALASGDREAALALLAPDVLVYEFGSEEASRDAYAAGHLASDMEFLKGVSVSTLDRRQSVHGDVAIVTTRTRTTGSYKDQPVDSFGTETLVLRRDGRDWRITHIHWSSRAAKKA
ncbi:MAG: YybH family protein [Nevskiaceae bacterium]